MKYYPDIFKPIYGAAYEEAHWLAENDPITHVHTHYGTGVLYYVNPDVLKPDTPPQPFLALDSLMNPADLDLAIHTLRDKYPDLRWVPDGCPLAVVKTHLQTFDEWVADVKLQPVYYRGQKHHQLEISHTKFPLIRFHELKQGVLRKSTKYTNVSPEVFGMWLRMALTYLDQGANLIYTQAVEVGTGQMVFNFVSCADKFRSRLVCPFIDLPDDEAMRNKYRAYMTAHVEMVRYAYQQKLSVADFGMFYPFKESLNMKREYVAGLRAGE